QGQHDPLYVAVHHTPAAPAVAARLIHENESAMANDSGAGPLPMSARSVVHSLFAVRVIHGAGQCIEAVAMGDVESLHHRFTGGRLVLRWSLVGANEGRPGAWSHACWE